jgi:hypothetical protein
MEKTKKGMSGGKKVAIMAGIAAAGASAYYLLGKNGKKHQKQIKEKISVAKKKINSNIDKAKKNIQKAKKVATPIYKEAKRILKK